MRGVRDIFQYRVGRSLAIGITAEIAVIPPHCGFRQRVKAKNAAIGRVTIRILRLALV